MGEKLEAISGEEAVRKFVRAGWTVVRVWHGFVTRVSTG